MPVAAGARQTRHLDAEHQPDIAKADLGDKPLKAQSALDAGARAAEIVVDDDDPLSYPAKLRRPIRERVLELCGLLMALNLLHRGLADINDRQTLLVAAENLVVDQAVASLNETRVRHRASPR